MKSLAEEVAARKAQRRAEGVPRDNPWRVAARTVIEVNRKALERLAEK